MLPVCIMDIPSTISSCLPLKKRPVRTTDFANVEELATPKRIKTGNDKYLSQILSSSLSTGQSIEGHGSLLLGHTNSSVSVYARKYPSIPSSNYLFRHLQPLIHATAFDYTQLDSMARTPSALTSSSLMMPNMSLLEAFHHLHQRQQMQPSRQSLASSSTSSPYSFLPASPAASHKSEESSSSTSTATAASGESLSPTGIQCQECGKVFMSRIRYRAHLRRHSSKTSGRYQCRECDKNFVQRSSLTTHMRIHTGERPFKCNMCPDSFGDYSTFTKHQRTHTGEKPYVCPVCRRSFSQSGNMHRHLKAVHH